MDRQSCLTANTVAERLACQPAEGDPARRWFETGLRQAQSLLTMSGFDPDLTHAALGARPIGLGGDIGAAQASASGASGPSFASVSMPISAGSA